MDFIRYAFDTRKLGLKEPNIRIYPFVCMHFGAKQCDLAFIKEHVQRIKKDPNGYWVYMGDAGECCTKFSKGDVYSQTMSPQGQADLAVEILKPIQGRGLFGVSGNHGRRIYKESGLDFDKNLCLRLGIPYLGLSAICNLVVNRSSYDIFVHHGSDSGTSLQGKVGSAEQFTRFINADALLTAHSHVAMELQPAVIYESDNQNCKIKTKMRKQFICGSAYDSRTGYAEEKNWPPILPSYLGIQFDGRIIEGAAVKKILSQRFESDGQHELCS